MVVDDENVPPDEVRERERVIVVLSISERVCVEVSESVIGELSVEEWVMVTKSDSVCGSDTDMVMGTD